MSTATTPNHSATSSAPSSAASYIARARAREAQAEAARVQQVRTSVMARLDAIAKGEGMKIGPASARYEASRRTRLNPQKANATGGAAFTHLTQADADAIRNDCNAAARDNPIARAFVKRSQDFTVGDGPIIKATTSTMFISTARSATSPENR